MCWPRSLQPYLFDQERHSIAPPEKLAHC
jgi:hypothetical protein